MKHTEALAELFSCPRCDEPLTSSLRCNACERDVMTVAGIPCLFEDAEARLEAWRRAAGALAAGLSRNVATVEQQLQRTDLLEETRTRLTRLQRGLQESRATLCALLHDASITAAPSPAGEPPPRLNLMECYVQTLRDWAWDGGDHEENREALELVTAALGDDRDLGKVLVLGAGGARLAYDIHRTLAPTITVALDINPLPFIIASKLLGGVALRLHEFPGTPRDAESVCVEHQLAAREPLDGLVMLLSDALSLCCRAGAFDTVITPWFIDQVPHDASRYLATLRWALQPGGRWLHQGPLIYRPTLPLANRYSAEELVQLGRRAGFDVPQPLERSVDYLRSPASAQSRREQVFAFAARRDDGNAERPERAWLGRADLPIPRFAGLAAYPAPNPVFAAVAQAIDGRTSAAEIAAQLVRRHGIPAEGAAEGVRLTVAQIFEACGAETSTQSADRSD